MLHIVKAMLDQYLEQGLETIFTFPTNVILAAPAVQVSQAATITMELIKKPSKHALLLVELSIINTLKL